MARDRRKRDALPEHFASVAQAADFWDSHDLADYWDLTQEAEFEVALKGPRYLVALDPELAERVAAEAHRRGLSAETLVNLWLSDKLQDSVA